MQATAIEVRMHRGRVIIQAIGRNPKGQRYIKGTVALKVKTISDPNFKGQMSAAVQELLDRDA